MAWTTPRNWTAGELVTDSIMNLHVRDNLLALKNPPSAGVYSATGFTTTSTSFVDIDASLNLSITTTGGNIFVVTFINGTGTGLTVQWVLDGVAQFMPAEGKFAARWLYPAAGVHTFKPQWKVTSGTGTMTVCYHEVREVS